MNRELFRMSLCCVAVAVGFQGISPAIRRDAEAAGQ